MFQNFVLLSVWAYTAQVSTSNSEWSRRHSQCVHYEHLKTDSTPYAFFKPNQIHYMFNHYRKNHRLGIYFSRLRFSKLSTILLTNGINTTVCIMPCKTFLLCMSKHCLKDFYQFLWTILSLLFFFSLSLLNFQIKQIIQNKILIIYIIIYFQCL